ncbi:hypothetical protein WN943_016646 [Citrus x changshan-huyou]
MHIVGNYSLALDLSLFGPNVSCSLCVIFLEHGHIFNLSLTVSPKISRKRFGVSEALFFTIHCFITRTLKLITIICIHIYDKK